MKNIFFVLLIYTSAASYGQHNHHTTTADTSKAKPKSPRTASMDMVGKNHVHIDYGSPSVRGRNIWNGLVAYGQVWATGAHKASWIEFSKDVKISGKTIPAGKYGFFTIPDNKEWTIIISKDWDMHLADDYKEENDIIRLKVKPKKSKNLTEALTYKVTPYNDKKGQVSMSWEYLSVAFDFENQ